MRAPGIAKKILALVAVLAFSLLEAGCGGGGSDSEGRTTARTAEHSAYAAAVAAYDRSDAKNFVAQNVPGAECALDPGNNGDVYLTIISRDSGFWVQYFRRASGVMMLAPERSGLDFEQDLPDDWQSYVSDAAVPCSIRPDGYITAP